MMRFLRLVILVVAGILSAAAQGDDALSRFGDRVAAVGTMSCKFKQTKTIALLSDELVSQGRMYYDKSGKLCWEYLTPYEYRFVLNNGKVYMGNDKRNNVADVADNKIFGTIARVMMNTVTGRIGELDKDFEVRTGGESPARVVTLVPKRREMKQLLKQVELTLDEKAGTVTHIRLSEKNGDVTDIALTDIKLNVPADETHFIIP